MLQSRFALRSNLLELRYQRLWGSVARVHAYAVQNDIDSKVFR